MLQVPEKTNTSQSGLGMKRLIDEGRRLVQTRSDFRSGNEELVNLLATRVAEAGLKVTLQHVLHSLEGVSKRQYNIIGILGDPLVDRKIKKGLLLTATLDTGLPGLLSGWTETNKNPYELVMKDEKLFGLGVTTGKIDFLCRLAAIQRFRDKKLRMPVYLVGTCGVEHGMLGAKYLIESMAVNPKYVLVGSPTGLRIGYTHKSLSVFKVSMDYQVTEKDSRGFNRRVFLSCFGRASHSASPAVGRNAILRLLQFVELARENGFDMEIASINAGESTNQVPDRADVEFYLNSHQFEDFKRFYQDSTQGDQQGFAYEIELGGLGDVGISFLPSELFSCILDIRDFLGGLSAKIGGQADTEFAPPGLTQNLSVLRQSQRRLEILFDIRMQPEQSLQDLQTQVQRGIQEIAAKYPALNVSNERLRMNPALDTRETTDWVRICKEVITEVSLPHEGGKLPLVTEGGFYSAKGYDALVFGPGEAVGNIYGPNECISLDDVQKAVLFYERLIARVCL